MDTEEAISAGHAGQRWAVRLTAARFLPSATAMAIASSINGDTMEAKEIIIILALAGNSLFLFCLAIYLTYGKKIIQLIRLIVQKMTKRMTL